MNPGNGIQAVRLPGQAGLRRALVVSFVFHLAAFTSVGLLARPRYTVPKRLQTIPVSLVGLAAPPPAQTTRAKAQPPLAAPAAEEKKPEVKAKPKPKPPEPKPKETRPAAAPLKTKPATQTSRRQSASQQPSTLPRRGSADSTNVRPSELPAVGNLRGWMQARVEGAVLPYSYYLAGLQQKIASYWEPPLGLERAGRETAATIRFQIGRDGSLQNRYVEEPSGTSVFDTSALRAVMLAAPFPPFPSEYSGEYLILHLRFVYAP